MNCYSQTDFLLERRNINKSTDENGEMIMYKKEYRFRINSADIDMDLNITGYNELKIANLVMNKIYQSFRENKGSKLVIVRGNVYKIPNDARLR